MRRNQITAKHYGKQQCTQHPLKIILSAMFLLSIYGCSTIPQKSTQTVTPDNSWLKKKQNISTAQKNIILAALASVKAKAASSYSLDSLGTNTLKESVTIIDHKKNAAPFIGEILAGRGEWAEEKNKPYYWKFCFWCIDIAGYLNENQLSESLYSIASDSTNKLITRIRAAKSLRELREKKKLNRLFLEVRKSKLREEIAKALLALN